MKYKNTIFTSTLRNAELFFTMLDRVGSSLTESELAKELGVSVEMLRHLGGMYDTMIKFKNSGEKVVRISKELRFALEKTDLYNQTFSQMKLPFNYLYLYTDTGSEFLEGMLICKFQDEKYNNQDSVFIVIINKQGAPAYIKPRPNETFSTLLDLADTQLKEYKTKCKETSNSFGGTEDMEYLIMLLNSIIYMTSYPAQLTKTQKQYKKKKKSKKNQNIPQNIYFLDAPIKLKTRIQEFLLGVSRGDRKIDHSFWVRGHWRHYTRSGETIWIEPHMRGLEYNTVINKPYEMSK